MAGKGSEPRKPGFIGLGNIDKPATQCIARSNVELTIFDLAAAPLAEMRAMGAEIAKSPAPVASDAEVVALCVRDDKDVRQLMYGSEGLLENGRSGPLVALLGMLKHSSIHEVGKAAAEKPDRKTDRIHR